MCVEIIWDDDEVTWDDLSEDLKELVEFGLFTKEEAFERHKHDLKVSCIISNEEKEMREWFESIIEDMIKEYNHKQSYYDTEALRKQGAIEALKELLRRMYD